MTVQILTGDAIRMLRTLPEASVHCVVTSPPYWGLRDYGVKGQLGLEPTIKGYLQKMVRVFREVRRVLRADGTIWVNMGDSYASSRCGGDTGHSGLYGGQAPQDQAKAAKRSFRRDKAPVGGVSHRFAAELKPKDLCMMPARVALALQADGWYLRSDIIEEVELYCPCGCGYILEERIWRWSQDRDLIWRKPNPMPESTKDRPTKSHEYVFLLSKSARYYFDQAAIAEPASPDTHARYARGRGNTHKNADGGPGRQTINQSFEHMRVPGNVNPAKGQQAFEQGDERHRTKGGLLAYAQKQKAVAGWANGSADHSAVAHAQERGGREGKLLPETQRKLGELRDDQRRIKTSAGRETKNNASFDASMRDLVPTRNKRSVWTIPTEAFPGAHFATFPTELVKPCILAGCPLGGMVLDPFGGAGTVGLVADRLQRNAILIELNADYAAMARCRIDADGPLFSTATGGDHARDVANA